MEAHALDTYDRHDPDLEVEPYDWNPLRCISCGEPIEPGRLALGALTCAQDGGTR